MPHAVVLLSHTLELPKNNRAWHWTRALIGATAVGHRYQVAMSLFPLLTSSNGAFYFIVFLIQVSDRFLSEKVGQKDGENEFNLFRMSPRRTERFHQFQGGDGE